MNINFSGTNFIELFIQNANTNKLQLVSKQKVSKHAALVIVYNKTYSKEAHTVAPLFSRTKVSISMVPSK